MSMVSNDGWNIFGMDRPSRNDYQYRAETHINFLDHMFPKELSLIIVEYGSTLILNMSGYRNARIAFDQICPGLPIPDCVEDVSGKRVTSIIINHIHYDLFNDGIWKCRIYLLNRLNNSQSITLSHIVAIQHIPLGWKVTISNWMCDINCSKLKFDESVF